MGSTRREWEALAAPVEELPFIVRVADSESDLVALARVRAAAYARHEYQDAVPATLASIDAADRRATLLVAQDKEDGSILGTLRVSASTRSVPPLPPQMPLQELAGEPYCYTDRFGVEAGALHDVVSLALIKAQWFVAYHEGAQWIVAAALRPLVRRYRMVGLRLLRGDGDGFQIPQLHADAYHAVGERLAAMPANLLAVAPFLAPFFLELSHPDIRIPVPARLGAHVAQARAAAALQAA